MSTPPRLFLSPPHMGGTELAHVQQAFDSNYIAPLGPKVNAFERNFEELTGFSHCAALVSGTAAMHLALELLGVRRGDTVVASSLTFIGSVSPAMHIGAVPVFVDSDRESWNMDPELLEQAVTALVNEGNAPKAVIPTDLYGQCADYDRIRSVCDRFGIPLVIDAAESVGAFYKGHHAGYGADAAIYSFNGNKIMTTSGGGMLGSDNGELVEKARWLSQQARDPRPYYEHTTIGYNYRMSNIVAAIGVGQLEVLEERVAKRRTIFSWYEEELADVAGLSFMPEASYGRCNRWLTVALFDPEAFGAVPEDVRLALEEHNIESRPVWKPMHMQPVFKGYGMFGGKVSEDLFARGLCLPSGTAMERADVERVCRILRRTGGHAA